MTLSIYPPGTAVLLGRHDDPPTDRPRATVLSASLRGSDYSCVSYLCSWWTGGDHREEWLDSEIVEPVDTTAPMMRVAWEAYP